MRLINLDSIFPQDIVGYRSSELSKRHLILFYNVAVVNWWHRWKNCSQVLCRYSDQRTKSKADNLFILIQLKVSITYIATIGSLFFSLDAAVGWQ